MHSFSIIFSCSLNISNSSNEIIITKIKNNNTESILNNIHKYVEVSKLNNFRVNLINKINSIKNFRENYYKIAKSMEITRIL